jgi:hypothetical protein
MGYTNVPSGLVWWSAALIVCGVVVACLIYVAGAILWLEALARALK